MGDTGRDQRDLVLDQSQYALVLDETKGGVISYVGPTKVSLAGTDKPVRFKNGKFEVCRLEESIQNFPRASEGYYIVLENPADDFSHPNQGAGAVPRLQHGRKINIPGPITFPLYPGQGATVIQGHHLRSNQYLVIRVHNEEEAKKNWDKAIIKSATEGEVSTSSTKWTAGDLTTGKLLVITGADASFYIPPTGIEVVPDEHNNFVRNAVTLERLEYAILLSEDGNKRWPKGPDVIFPSPTETFVVKEGKVKFRAIELNENAGIYVKVIADYEEDDTFHAVGDELFITGKEQSIYFPRPEHALIKYGDQEIHYAIAIPEGEGRYVLDKVEGKVNLVMGPKMFLPDPRREVVVRRILDDHTVDLWFPGNEEAILVNQKLAAETDTIEALLMRRGMTSKVETLGGDRSMEGFNRKTTYTAPRTITLDTKYEGAVKIDIYTGYAVMVMSATGERNVIKGPKRILLGYNESLEKMALSTGKPKNTDKLFETVYLRVLHNKISDLVTIETQDLCEIDLKLSYRVNFIGDEKKWFDIENYVKFLCDHLRSVLKCAAKKISVENLYANATSFVRDTILGISEDGKRLGKHFEENGMHVYDVEVLGCTIRDPDIQHLLMQHQKTVVKQNLVLAEKRRNKEQVFEEEKIAQEIEVAKNETVKLDAKLAIESISEKLKAKLADVQSSAEIALKKESAEDALDNMKLAREEARTASLLKKEQALLDQKIVLLKAEMEAFLQKAGSISPQMIQALQAFGDKLAIDSACKSMAPLAILGGDSVADVVRNMFSGTSLGEVLTNALTGKRD